MRPTKQSPDQTLQALQTTFRAHGFEGSSLTVLSESTDLKRASLYHRFPGGKEQMALAVLDKITGHLEEKIYPLLQERPVSDCNIEAVFEELDRYYDGGRKMCLLAVFMLGYAPPALRVRVQAITKTWHHHLHTFLQLSGHSEAAALEMAERILVEIHGGLVLAAQLDDPAPFKRALNRAKGILSASAK